MENPIIILHGWEKDGSTYRDARKLLEKEGYEVFAPDMPGFGDEKLIHEDMDLSDYVEFINKFIEKNKLQSVILIGHSFGGRVSLKYAWKYPEKVSKLILTGVPIIRYQTLKKKAALLGSILFGGSLQKTPKIVQRMARKLLYFTIGEWDYYKAGSLKKTLSNVVREDLTGYTKKINIPIYLIWGETDKLTPVSDVKKIENLNPHIKSIVIYDTGHKLPYDKPKEFVEAVLKFIR